MRAHVQRKLIVFALILTLGGLTSWMVPTRTEKQNDTRWKSLFNGKDLSGWVIHGTEKWYAKNGELICESGPDKEYGYLATGKK